MNWKPRDQSGKPDQWKRATSSIIAEHRGISTQDLTEQAERESKRVDDLVSGDARDGSTALPTEFEYNRSHQGTSRRLSPKRPVVDPNGLADLFPYYAGYSFEWARNKIEKYANCPESIVLDPWNGSGTTTLAARYANRSAIGIDRNPVANVAAAMRTFFDSRAVVLSPPGTTSTMNLKRRASDPLAIWFAPRTAGRIRQWVDHADSVGNGSLTLVAIFRIVRRLTRSFEGSNPTWVRRARQSESRVELTNKEVDRLICAEQQILVHKLADVPRPGPHGTSAIITGTADKLPVRDSSVDLVITSPPYLTRIDYAVAYSRELAVLGLNVFTDRSLRAHLMGTTLIRSQTAQHEIELTQPSADLIRMVSGHASKDSAGYYCKQVRQYLFDLTRALDELSRVAKPSSIMCLVVQNSYYKDIPVELDKIYTSEAVSRGWSIESTESFDVVRSLTSLNRSAQAYKKGKVSETVLTLRRL